MKKTVCLLAFIAASGSTLLAQPTLQMNVVPEVGDFIYWARADSSTAQPGSPGANQTWDFSDLSSSTQPTRYEYFTPANTPYANEFPMATLATKHTGNDSSHPIYSYFQKGANEFLYLGFKLPLSLNVYTDSDMRFQYPLNYTDTYQDEFASIQTLFNIPDDPNFSEGMRTVEYDAYGTLITPLDTFPNAMRIRTTTMQIDSTTYYYDQSVKHESRTTYDWVVAHQPGPLVSISYYTYTKVTHYFNFGITTTEVSPKIKTVSYISAGSVSALSQPKPLEGLGMLSLGPNPTTDLLTLRFSIERISALQIRLTDAGGRTLRIQKQNAVVGENKETLFVGDLPTGAYFLSLTDGRGIKTVAWQKI